MKKNFNLEKVQIALLQFGLTEKEISTYLTLLENGASSVQEISRKNGINRVTIYAAVEELKKKGLIAESKKGRRKLLVAEAPDNLREILLNRKERLKKEENELNRLILPALKAISVNQENKPRIRYFEGVKGMSVVFDYYTLKYRSLIGCGSYEAAMKVTSWKDEAWYLREIKRRKIIYRAILQDTPLDRKFSEKFKGNFHTKFLPPEAKVTADIHVFGHYVALMSYETLGTTLIEDKSIAESMKLYLDFMWERL